MGVGLRERSVRSRGFVSRRIKIARLKNKVLRRQHPPAAGCQGTSVELVKGDCEGKGSFVFALVRDRVLCAREKISRRLAMMYIARNYSLCTPDARSRKGKNVLRDINKKVKITNVIKIL